MEGRESRGSVGNKLLRIYNAKKRKTGGTCKGESKKSGGNYRRGVGDREKMISKDHYDLYYNWIVDALFVA